MIGIAFNVENFTRSFIHATDKTATNGTITTDRRYLLGNFNPIHLTKLVRIAPGRIQVKPQAGQGDPASDGAGHG